MDYFLLHLLLLCLITIPESRAQDDFSSFFDTAAHVVPMPTSTPTQFQATTLMSFQSSYRPGEVLSFSFVYGSRPRPNINDWIGIYRSDLNPSANDAVTFLFWCNNQTSCEGSPRVQEGQVHFGEDTILASWKWPVDLGEYKAFFVQGVQRPFEILAESDVFRIEIDMHTEVVIPAVQAIEQEIRDLIALDETMGPKFVRLGFHDCTGGCDGCVDLTFPDNGGLHIPIDALRPIVANHENADLGISRADIWALAAHVGADVAQTRSATKVDFQMEFIGRQNCETTHPTCFDMNNNIRECSETLGPHVHLPEAHITTEALFHFFFEEFGFDIQETVALMGAHTLGSLNRLHSGFDGPNGWVRDNLLLDNDYYHELVGGQGPDASMDELIDRAPPWDRFRINNEDLPGVPNQPAWIAFPPAFDGSGPVEILMLNADVSKGGIIRITKMYLSLS